MSTSESIPISDIQKLFSISAGFKLKTLFFTSGRISSQLLCLSKIIWMSDIGYRIKVYSNIRYNVGLRSLQSDIGSSDIKLSPISLVTDIGVSAHLWYFLLLSSTWSGYLPSTPVEGVVGRTMGQQGPNRPGWSNIIPAERGILRRRGRGVVQISWQRSVL